MRTPEPFALSVAAPAAKSKSKLGARPVAFDFAALCSGRTGKAPPQVRKCTNLLWSDLEGPIEKDGGVWIRWRASYTRAGIPPLAMEGEERAVFVGDRIKLLEDRASDAEVQKIVTYFGQYGSKLKS